MKTNRMQPRSKFTASAKWSLPRSFVKFTLISLFLLASLPSLSATTFQVQVGPNGGNTFSPKDLSIQVGDTVEWTWQSDDHSVTSGTVGNPDGLFDSGIQNTGFTFSFTFNDAGTFPYFCMVHGACCGMVGSVTVG